MRTTVHIQNLKCGGCANTIINKLTEIQGVYDVSINNKEESVSFDFNTPHDFEEAKHVLSRIGYPIIGKDNTLKTKATSYISCAIGRLKK